MFIPAAKSSVFWLVKKVDEVSTQCWKKQESFLKNNEYTLLRG